MALSKKQISIYSFIIVTIIILLIIHFAIHDDTKEDFHNLMILPKPIMGAIIYLDICPKECEKQDKAAVYDRWSEKINNCKPCTGAIRLISIESAISTVQTPKAYNDTKNELQRLFNDDTLEFPIVIAFYKQGDKVRIWKKLDSPNLNEKHYNQMLTLFTRFIGNNIMINPNKIEHNH